MLRQNKIFLSLLLLSFLASLTIKVYLDQHAYIAENNAVKNSPPERVLSVIIQNQKLSLRQEIAPVNRGNFPIQIYHSTECNGAIALILLEKNAEGAAILAYQTNRPLNEISYIFNNQIYDSFPSLDYWFERVLRSLHIREKPSNILSSYVIGAIEVGHCSLLKTMNWRV